MLRYDCLDLSGFFSCCPLKRVLRVTLAKLKICILVPSEFITLSTFREGTSLMGGGRGEGWPGLQRGGSLVNILQIVEGQTCFIRNWGSRSIF